MDCSRSSRQTSASSRGAFKRLGADAAKMAVAAGSVVERFDVVEDIGARQIPSLVDALLDAFLLQAAEEGLGNGIVPAVASPAHARLEVVGCAESPEVVASILAALVAVDHHALLRLATPHGHQQGI